MGGFGFSLRPRPTPHFAVDFGADFVGGFDSHGYLRDEAALLINPMLFLNPRDKLQVYLLGGLGLSWARVQNAAPYTLHYSYVGADLGMGVEWRFARSMAFGGDVLEFIRRRTNQRANSQPEFVDRRTGQTRNSSGGVLFRVGLTFYW